MYKKAHKKYILFLRINKIKNFHPIFYLNKITFSTLGQFYSCLKQRVITHKLESFHSSMNSISIPSSFVRSPGSLKHHERFASKWNSQEMSTSIETIKMPNDIKVSKSSQTSTKA